MIWLGVVCNVIIQAGLLAVSLAALAYHRDVVRTWVAIVTAVGGVVLLAGTMWTVPIYRNALENFSEALSYGERAIDDDVQPDAGDS